MKNGLTTLLLFFYFENAQNLGRSDDAKQRKKRGWSKCTKNLLDVCITGKASVDNTQWVCLTYTMYFKKCKKDLFTMIRK